MKSSDALERLPSISFRKHICSAFPRSASTLTSALNVRTCKVTANELRRQVRFYVQQVKQLERTFARSISEVASLMNSLLKNAADLRNFLLSLERSLAKRKPMVIASSQNRGGCSLRKQALPFPK